MMLSLTNDEFNTLTNYMKSNFGINLEKKRTLIEGRLTNYVIDKGFSNFTDYLAMLFGENTETEVTKLVNFLTTNYSYFMREWEHFEFFRNRVLPELKQTVTNHDLRIWSAGCSTGEEPYTIAMLLSDFFGTEQSLWDMKVLATDISERALESARRGVYAEEQLEKLPPGWRSMYFRDLGSGRWEVKPALRGEVIFRTFNLMEEQFPFQKLFHVIYCRNVMIYFDKETKAELIRKFYRFTEPGGYLFVGQSESINRDETGWKYVMPSVFRKG
jgi:chemotaxis protein methyltransferase CheR